MFRILSSSIIILALSACAPQRVAQDEYYYPTPLRKRQYYLVKHGDSLWNISKKYGVSVEEIMRENKISSPRKLKSGRYIVIPPCTTKYAGLSFLWPLEGKVINAFGENINNVVNNGLNIKSATDAHVKTSAEGEVVFSDYLRGWGNTLIIKHRHRFYTIYANLSTVSAQEGDRVKRGEVIGKVGPSDSEGYILHFEIRKGHLPQNPLRYLVASRGRE
ncbi:MAG: peptidoglycan DD-metalloendopeptidase family protein [Candidatus Omnitrophota bacterium]|nr:MAG: peptidoglycan DD-metalloendopeptidase family protein [Candidatus Omnitrophota bacterium]